MVIVKLVALQKLITGTDLAQQCDISQVLTLQLDILGILLVNVPNANPTFVYGVFWLARSQTIIRTYYPRLA
jgi:hypothetical protein